MRLIDADALEQIITEKFKEHYGNTVYQFIRDFFTFVIRQIRKAPTVEAEPVKHGRWVFRDPDNYGNRKPYCTNCGKYHLTVWSDYTQCNYCPHCGAKMHGGAENA